MFPKIVGTQQPWFFLLKMIILGWRLGVPPFKRTHPYIDLRFHVKHLSCFSISSSLAEVLRKKTINGPQKRTIVDRPAGWHMGVSNNRGFSPKMDGENNGKPYFLMDALGGENPLFLETSISEVHNSYKNYTNCLFWCLSHPRKSRGCENVIPKLPVSR